MREIQFRGKRTDNGEWVCGCLTRYSEKMSYITVDLIENEVYQVDASTVGQYTGLKDKNGKEIYEGDIVREFANDYTPIYQNGIYMAYNVDKINEPHISTQFNVIWRNGCEVIGNIYENPELMAQTND